MTEIYRQCRTIAGKALHFSASEGGTSDDIFPLCLFQEQLYGLKTGKEFISVGVFPIPDKTEFDDALARASLSYVNMMVYFFMAEPESLPETINNNAYTEHDLPPFIKISMADEGPVELTCSPGIILPQQIAEAWRRL
ncbi:hypothetical protein [Chitinophaga rhizosphaerae]|uniref:hypothetical protein n=1 Tax=Chitinophaga rhizosphaerae TaxID=1864947 RepID=UPI0013E076DE|nr:hypothetical protein [Chitinophaga rhizosphaerae]